MNRVAAAPRYSTTAIVLHWLGVLLIVAAVAVGSWMTELPSGVLKLKAYNWHKWIGSTFLALALLRLLWRATHRPPPAPPMPRWEARAAAAVQAAMMVLFVGVPLLGWAYSSALGYPLVWFGVLPLPDWVPQDRALADAIKPWHRRCSMLLVALALVHVAAALKHHWIDRDGVLQRMAPWVR